MRFAPGCAFEIALGDFGTGEKLSLSVMTVTFQATACVRSTSVA